jgi:hypothetical protein
LPWRNNSTYKNFLTNERLFLLLNRLSAQEWVVELTGGEPALYPELDELLNWLQAKNFHGLIKTNGTLPIRRVPSFKIIAAFHELQNPPRWYDEILIINHTPDSESKIKWCIEHGIKFGVIERDTYSKPTSGKSSGRIMFVNPAGSKSECSGGQQRIPLEEAEFPSRDACPGCKTFKDFNIFFNEV